MKTIAALLLFCCASVAALAQRIPIESAQRDFQARYSLVKNAYVDWPACGCGPAPQFPTNEFYGDLSADPDLAVKLVQDLALKFFLWETEIFTYFVDTPDGTTNIENQNPIPKYDEADFEYVDPYSVNQQNDPDAFNTLRRYIDKLAYLELVPELTSQ